MARYCSDCTYLNPKKQKDNIPGYCYCSKIKKHVLAHCEGCEKFEEAYARRWYDREKLYEEGKEAENKASSSESSGIFLAVILIILLFILKIFKVI